MNRIQIPKEHHHPPVEGGHRIPLMHDPKAKAMGQNKAIKLVNHPGLNFSPFQGKH